MDHSAIFRLEPNALWNFRHILELMKGNLISTFEKRGKKASEAAINPFSLYQLNPKSGSVWTILNTHTSPPKYVKSPGLLFKLIIK